MARLTTHVLDVANGRPAAGVALELSFLEPGEEGGRRLLRQAVTGADGRCDRPLLEGPALPRGTYEIVFHVGRYFREIGAAVPDPAFLEQVPVRFGVADPEGDYHVPLLVAPWGYSTYRGA